MKDHKQAVSALKTNYYHIKHGADNGLCLVLFSGALLLFSFMTDIIIGGANEIGVGETSKAAGFLYGTGNILMILAICTIAVGIGTSVEKLSFSPALVGGFLASIGSTLPYPEGTTSSASGIAGGLVAGLTAGYCCKLLRSTLKKKSILKPYLNILLSTAITIGVVILLNYLCRLLFTFSSSVLAVLREKNLILTAMLIGCLMTIDVSGPLYRSAYVFGTASIVTEDPIVMGIVAGVSIVPPLSIGMSSIIFRKSFTQEEKIVGVSGLFFALGGITQSALYNYIVRPSLILPCALGGTVTAAMISLFMCKSTAPMGGILAIKMIHKPVCFILSVICGTIVSCLATGIILLISEKRNIKRQP